MPRRELHTSFTCELLDPRVLLAGDFVGLAISTESLGAASNVGVLEGEIHPPGIVQSFGGDKLQQSGNTPLSFPFDTALRRAVDGSDAGLFDRSWEEQESGWTGVPGERLGWRYWYDKVNGPGGEQPGVGWELDLWLERPDAVGLSESFGDWNVSALTWTPGALPTAQAASGVLRLDSTGASLLSGDQALLGDLVGVLSEADAQGKSAITGSDGGTVWAYLGATGTVMIGIDTDPADGSLTAFIATRAAESSASVAGEYRVTLGFDTDYAQAPRFDGTVAAAGELELRSNGTFVYESEAVDDREFEGTWSHDTASGVLTLASGGFEVSLAVEPTTRTLLALSHSGAVGSVFGLGVLDHSEGDDDDDGRGRGRGRGGDDFVESFRVGSPRGLSDDDSVRDVLRVLVPDAAYARAPWTAENYWFQTGSGEVYSLWHGGAVHQTDDGEHTWVLTNLAEAGGIATQMEFAPGSMTGTIAPWRAFSIQGVVNGELVSLWWSPESGQRGWGNNANGWVLTTLDAGVLRDPATGDAVSDLPQFRTFTETQSNGRLTFDPRASRTDLGGGMSVVLVDVSDNVYVATFTTQRQASGVSVPTGLTNIWLLQRLEDVPGLERNGLLGSIDAYRSGYVTRANS